MPKISSIHIDVSLDDDKIPEDISWKATDSTADSNNKARAMMLSFWDSADKNALRIDLWTKKMMVDEMADFMYQTIMGMADTFERATRDNDLTAEMKKFARDFLEKFRSKQEPAASAGSGTKNN
jgi:gliding motility-associated protein GldC